MLFTKDVVWFKQFNIHYAIGVDGISVALLVLTSIVVLAGVFISWKMKDLPKEFFISLISSLDRSLRILYFPGFIHTVLVL